jgi:hypothetical protein
MCHCEINVMLPTKRSRISAQRRHVHVKGTAWSVNAMYCSRNNGSGLLCSVRSVTEVLWDVQYSLFSLQEPECKGLLGARP